MKNTIKMMAITVFVIISTAAYSQNYSSAETVYYTPIKDRVYFAIEMKSVYTSHLTHKVMGTESDYEQVENDIITFVEYVPEYEINGDYSKGDILRIKVKEESPYGDYPATYTYIKIVGEVDTEFIDNKVVEMSEGLFGEGVVQPWPKDLYEEKLGASIPNEKAVECDYYVLSSLHNITPELTKWYYDSESGLNVGDAGNLIVFEATPKDSGDREYVVKEIDNLTTRHYKISIHQKLKTGKKGKKIGGATINYISSADQYDVDKKEAEINPFESEEIELREPSEVAWMQMNDITDKLVYTNSSYFQQKIPEGIAKAFSKIK